MPIPYHVVVLKFIMRFFIPCCTVPGTVQNAFVPPSKKLTIVHFNDVYIIEEREREPVGGAARFKTVVDSLSDKNPLVLFSGDAIAPSNSELMSLYYA